MTKVNDLHGNGSKRPNTGKAHAALAPELVVIQAVINARARRSYTGATRATNGRNAIRDRVAGKRWQPSITQALECLANVFRLLTR